MVYSVSQIFTFSTRTPKSSIGTEYTIQSAKYMSEVVEVSLAQESGVVWGSTVLASDWEH